MSQYYDGAIQRLLALIPIPASKILDVGCAHGALGEALKAHRPEREVWGIEYVPDVAEHARRRLDHVLVGDVEKMDPLPLPEGYFDCAIFGHGLEHLREPQVLLQRVQRHLKADGRLLACAPNIGHWSVLTELLGGSFRYANSGLLDRTHLRFFTPSTLRSMLWDSGFVIEKEDPHYLDRPEVTDSLAHLASSFGINPAVSRQSLATYQQVVSTRLRPSAEDPEKRSILIGPHAGTFGVPSKRCSISTVTYNSADTINACIESVLATLSPDDEWTIVDNASKDTTVDLLHAWAEKDPRVKVEALNENLGFAKSTNLGLVKSKGAFLVMLNPDTVVWPGWIEGLMKMLADPQVGAAGPISDNTAGEQFVGLHLQPGVRPQSAEELMRLISARHNVPPKLTKMLMGFCMMLRRDTANLIGLLDEQMFLGADDLDLSWRVRELGFVLAIAQDVFVHHDAGASFASLTAEERPRATRQADSVLRSKLGSYYPCLPSSLDLWDSEIAEGLLSH